MKMKYTRHQIREALKYWTQRLHVIDESVNRTIDALVEKFGEDLVFSSEKIYVLTKDDLNAIYNILNINLFDGKLGKIRLEYWPEYFIVEKLNENAIKSGVQGMLDVAKCYGAFSGVCKDVLDENGNIIDINISEEIIMINKTYLTYCIFIFAVASICHEMIHFADRYSDEYHDNMLMASKTDKDFDSHKDKVFQTMMKKANDEGIHVTETLAETSYDDANKDALYRLKSVISENDDAPHINQMPHTLVMRGKNQHRFFFAEFD